MIEALSIIAIRVGSAKNCASTETTISSPPSSAAADAFQRQPELAVLAGDHKLQDRRTLCRTGGKAAIEGSDDAHDIVAKALDQDVDRALPPIRISAFQFRERLAGIVAQRRIGLTPQRKRMTERRTQSFERTLA